jgi:UDP-N-acetylglucosamine 2-epimerase (non-hydrolysing)
MKLLFVFGTRPEAIKMAPVLIEGGKSKVLQVEVCLTGQHREMLDQVLRAFDLETHYDLNIMTPGQSLTEVTVKLLRGMDRVLERASPDYVLVHGDTTTTFSASLASFYKRIPVAHVEAGLRTRNLYAPWPEEANRQLTGRLAALHFAPTEQARRNLLDEGVEEAAVHVTGNTVIDALRHVSQRLDSDLRLSSEISRQFPFLDQRKRLVLVTGHRRENFGSAFERVCLALRDIATDSQLQIVYPVHLNPNVQEPVRRILSGLPNVFLIDPIDYLPFVYLMKKSSLILTDSGGVQEEAPTLGKPVLLLRETTERPEGIASGLVTLVGSDRERIVIEARSRLAGESISIPMKTWHPFGDGFASERILSVFERMALI